VVRARGLVVQPVLGARALLADSFNRSEVVEVAVGRLVKIGFRVLWQHTGRR
jgi:hypothetical protein